jgi:hypothetical protein
MFAALVGVLYSGGSVHADGAYTYSGTLKDGSGVAISGATVTLTDASANTVSGTTASDGSFSISAGSGTYLLSVSGNTSGSAPSAFSLAQTGTPSIDLTSGGVVQNLVLPVATVNYTLYNAQGYQLTTGGYLNANGGSGTVSLYAGDPGETLSGVNYSVHAAGATGSFTSVVGAHYSSVCDQNQSLSNGGCTSLTVAAGTNSVIVPAAPAPTKTFSGTLKTSTGSAINNATIALTDAYGNKVSGTTNSYGSFSLSVEPGMYNLSVNAYYGSNVPYGSSTTFVMSQTGTPTIDLTSGNVVQNLAIPVTQVSFYSTDLQRSPYSVTMNGTNSSVSLYAGDPGESATVNSRVTVQSMYASPTNYFTSIAGTVYAPNSICFNDMNGGGGNSECTPSSITVGAGSNNIDVPTVPGPTLTVSSPTSVPVLNWTDPAYVTNYIVYRDGVQIQTTTGTSYTDNNVAPGTHTYSVVAVDSAGDTGGTTTTVNVVLSLPSLGTPSFSVNPVVKGGSTVVTIPISNQYGVLGGEYFIGTDPGQGNGLAMFYSNGVLMATIPAGSVTGDQILYFRAHNSAGWSATSYAVLHVVIAAPTGLTSTTPTAEPVLTWNSSPSASLYNIYRDGSQIGTSATTSFTDNNVASGTHIYNVVAVDSAGIASSPSSPISVVVVYAKPVLGNPELSAESIVAGQSVTVTVNITGNLYGVLGGEYFIGTDPGQGNGIFMSYSNGVLTATISGLSVGAQIINVRADNAAGWSDAVAKTVDVTNSVFSGVFTDSNGNVIAGATITLYDAGGHGVSATTGSDGSFSIAVVPGTYYLAVVDSNVDGMSVTMRQSSSSPSIVVTAGSNVTQNLVLPVAAVNFVAYNSNGSLATSGQVVADVSGANTSPVSLYAGDSGYYVTAATTASVNGQGQGSFNSLVGVAYGGSNWGDGICLGYTNVCNATPFTVASGTSSVAIPSMPAPTLTVSSPTALPSLSWSAVSGAISYKVYRDGSLVNTTSTTSFVDNNVSGGMHTYYVVAVNSLGIVSAPSAVANVTVNLIAPTLGTPSVSGSSITQGQTVIVTIPVLGNLYGLTGGEYYLGSTDPGQGHGIAMIYSNGVLTVVLSNLPAGNQTINIRAKNSAGWSAVVTTSVNVVLPTFSGTLTDSNGVALVGVSMTVKNAYGDSYSLTTGAGGSYSFSVKPGLYYISNLSGSNIDGIYSFTLAQLSANASFNLLTGNVVQNLVLPVATINYTAYNSQGYAGALNVTATVPAGSTAVVSLYTGDPGETVATTTGTMTASSAGAGSFKTIAGVTYVGTGSANGICDTPTATGSKMVGCVASYMVASGSSTVSIPYAPAPRNTYSGVLTDSNGVVLVGVAVKLSDGYGNTVSTTTAADGSFSLAVEPGVYALTLSGTSAANVDNLGAFTVQQFTPGINLMVGGFVQNLVLPVAAMNVTLYNTQGYANSGGTLTTTTAMGTISLYTGDPGELASITGMSRTADGSGTVTFNTILGVAYNGTGLSLSGPALGSDGAIWYGYTFSPSSGPVMYGLGSVNAAGSFTTYPISADFKNPGNLVALGGSVFYVESPASGTDSYIGRRDSSGVITNYDITASRAGFHFGTIVAGSDGNIWFAGVSGIGRLNISTGAATFYGACASSYNGPANFVAASDGNLYYTVVYNGSPAYTYLCRLNPTTGVSTIFQTYDSYSNIQSLASGSNNTLWAWDYYYNRTYEIALVAGASSGIFTLPGNGLYGGYGSESNLVAGSDGNEWLVETGGPTGVTRIAKVTPSGVLMEYALASGVNVSSLVAGSDSALWFMNGGTIGRITTSGAITMYNLSSPATNGLCDSKSGTTYGCIAYAPVSGVNAIALPTAPAPRNSFSGTLTGSDGFVFAGVTMTLRDVYGNVITTTTGSDGSFSLSVEPGLYALTVSTTSNLDTLGAFTFQQSSASPSIDLRTASISQNLVVPVGTVNVALYNNQGYVNAYGKLVTSSLAGSTSLYAGDPGMVITLGSGATFSTNSSGAVSFKSVGGLTYGTGSGSNGFCDYTSSMSLYGCVTYTVVNGINNVALPTAPAPRNSFSGTLTDQNGNAIVGATITLVDAYSNYVSGTVGNDGSFSLSVEPGRFRLSSISVPTGADGLASFSMSQSGAPSIDLTTGNVTKALVLPVATVYYTNYWTGGIASFTGTAPSTVSLYAGDPGETVSGSLSNSGAKDVSGPVSGSFNTIVGTVYAAGSSICYYTGTSKTCTSGSLTVGAGPYYLVTPQPQYPQNVHVTLQAGLPSLSWNVSLGVTGYIVYRDGTVIATVTTTTFVDNNVSSGSRSYKVVATDSAGNRSSDSSTVNITVSAATPTLGTATLGSGTVVAGQSTTVTAPVTGNLYGVTGGEYYIGTDPGQGNGTALTYSNGQLTGTVTSTTPGNQTVYVRAHNGTGWGSTVSVSLTVLPTAPTGLTASSPTAEPGLSWTAVTGATSYDIYRDGTKIDSSTTAAYVDTTATDGTHSYYVKAVDADGSVSAQSNSVSVVVSSIAGNAGYFTTDDGTTVSRQATPVTTGNNTQVVNADGSITLAASSATGTAESGLTLWTGKLSDLPTFTVTSSGDPFVVKLWFDAGGDGSFFQWDASGNLTSQNGDTTGQGPDPADGSLTVDGDNSFYMADATTNYTLAELVAGDDTTSGITGDTIVTVWIGVAADNGSASATITSVGALE